MSNELVSRTPIRASQVNDTLELAKVMADSGFFTDARSAAQAAVKVMAGRELGFGPVTSMTGINIIKGRVTLSANLIATAIQRSGRYAYRVKRLDNQQCDVEVLKDNEVIGISTFTMADAKQAGLYGDNWKKYPRNMLFARAISNAAKWYCPDVFGGPVYTPDELGVEVDAEDGTVIELPPESVRVLPRTAMISAGQQEELMVLVRRKGADLAKLLAYYEIGNVSDLTEEQFDDAVGRLVARADVPTLVDKSAKTTNAEQDSED